MCSFVTFSSSAFGTHRSEAVNSTVRLTGSETKMTSGPTRATVHPYRTSSCRNNLQQQVAPRRQGPWVPSLSRNGVFRGPPPWCNTHAGSRVPLGNVADGPLSLWVASPGVLSQLPFVTWSVLGSPPFRAFHHCPVAGGH